MTSLYKLLTGTQQSLQRQANKLILQGFNPLGPPQQLDEEGQYPKFYQAFTRLPPSENSEEVSYYILESLHNHSYMFWGVYLSQDEARFRIDDLQVNQFQGAQVSSETQLDTLLVIECEHETNGQIIFTIRPASLMESSSRIIFARI